MTSTEIEHFVSCLPANEHLWAFLSRLPEFFAIFNPTQRGANEVYIWQQTIR